MLQGAAEIRDITLDEGAYADSLGLRYRVLYRPFGLGRELAAGHEPEGSVHVGAFDGGTLIGYARLVPVGAGAVKLYQVCVDPEREGAGIGTALVNALLGRALGMGVADVVLDARVPAVSFYERFGFSAEGPEFRSPRTGTPHRAMRLPLRRGL